MQGHVVSGPPVCSGGCITACLLGLRITTCFGAFHPTASCILPRPKPLAFFCVYHTAHPGGQPFTSMGNQLGQHACRASRRLAGCSGMGTVHVNLPGRFPLIIISPVGDLQLRVSSGLAAWLPGPSQIARAVHLPTCPANHPLPTHQSWPRRGRRVEHQVKLSGDSADCWQVSMLIADHK